MMRSSASVNVGDCRGGTQNPLSEIGRMTQRKVTNNLVAGRGQFGCIGISGAAPLSSPASARHQISAYHLGTQFSNRAPCPAPQCQASNLFSPYPLQPTRHMIVHT